MVMFTKENTNMVQGMAMEIMSVKMMMFTREITKMLKTARKTHHCKFGHLDEGD